MLGQKYGLVPILYVESVKGQQPATATTITEAAQIDGAHQKALLMNALDGLGFPKQVML